MDTGTTILRVAAGSLAVTCKSAGHPNGDNNGEIHWAIRRWAASAAGTYIATYGGQKQNNNCGNGTVVLRGISNSPNA